MTTSPLRIIRFIFVWLILVHASSIISANTRSNNINNNNKKHGKPIEAPILAALSSTAASDSPPSREADVSDLVTTVLTDDHIVTNIALNKSVRLSSSASADPNYARLAVDGDEDTFVESTIEKYDPYLVVDLGSESYIDEIIIISPHDLGDVASFATDQKSLAFSRNMSDLMEKSTWHTSALVAGSRATFHAHTTGRYVRVQRMSPAGKLVVSEVIVRGVKLNPREKLFSQCLSGHDGSEVCSSRGVCSHGRCNCGAFYSGLRCERVRVSVFTTCSSFVVVAFGLLMLTKRFRYRFRKRRSGIFKKSDPENADADGPQEDACDQQRLIPKNSTSSLGTTNGADDIVRVTRCSTPSTLPTQRPSLLEDSSLPNFNLPYKLHVLFSTPLVLLTHTEVIPVSQLDVERECELLTRSLAQAGAQRRITMEVTCATIDALQSVLTLREASVIHISSHCQPDLIALEDTNGAAHLVSIEALGNLLAASKPATHASRLVVLNSCHSAGVARAFVNAGFEHVVALNENYRVRDVTAATFTRAFYLALASAHTIGDAFRIAKEAVSLCPGATPGEASAFVLLPESGHHDDVIWPRHPIPSHSLSPSPSMPLFSNPCQIPTPCEDFVGRSHELWTVLQMLQRYRVVNLYGSRGCGKTATVVQLANHARIRKSEAMFADGVFFVSLEQKVQLQLQDDEFAHELLCTYIADMLASSCSVASPPGAKTGSGLSASVSPQNTLRRSISKNNRENVLQKFALEKPCSLLILDGLSPSVLASKPFYDCISILLRASSKLHIVTSSESRLEKPSIRVVNVLCGPLSDLDTARLLIRLCHPKLVAPSVSRTEFEAQPWEDEGDEFEMTARGLSKCAIIRSLMGHPENIRKLASTVNARYGMGETFSLTDEFNM